MVLGGCKSVVFEANKALHKASVTFVFLVKVGPGACDEIGCSVKTTWEKENHRTIMFHILVTCVVLPSGLPHQCFGKIANHAGVMWDETFNQWGIKLARFKCNGKATNFKCCGFQQMHCDVSFLLSKDCVSGKFPGDKER